MAVIIGYQMQVKKSACFQLAKKKIFLYKESRLLVMLLASSNWFINNLYPGAWVDQRNCQGGYLVIPQHAGWITSYPPVVIGYIMQT